MSIDPTTWLLMRNYPDGKPWGTKTNMADRAKAGGPYWDEKCKVTRLVGSYRAMCAMRDELEQLILDANSSALPPGQRGHVYIADWRMSTVRDFSTKNPWQTGPWKPSQLAQYKDQTAIGLFLRLMQAGVVLRILLWYPTTVQSAVAGLTGHIEDHSYLACIIHEENERLKPILNSSLPLGIVGLDARTAEGAVAGAHHQKMMVIRAPGRNVAFCGGVDLTFTRRDAPSPVRVDTFDPTTVAFLDGDWQSATMPDVKPVYPGNLIWPPDGNTKYDAVLKVNPPSSRMPTDLPMHTDDKDVCEAIGGLWHDDTKTCEYTAYTPAKGTYPGTQQRLYGLANHVWHDQHLKLQGPIVSTLEWQFAERWIDAGRCNVLTFVDWARGWVLFSSAEAYDSVVDPTVVHPLPTPAPEPAAGGSSIVQMWRTIPLRRSRGTGQLFDGGEFTVMSGYTKAINAAKELIWIFDQYMWSEAATRQLNYRLRNSQNLCVLMVLPPFADSTYKDIHRARHFALAELMRDLTTDQATRVAVYDLWQPSNHVKANGRGVYVHAKTQTYDGALLVCGSANFNRRSLMCDTELACAVLDTAVVAQHQRDLWQLLFGNVTTQDGAWPGLDLNGTGSGAKFLKAFRAAAASE
ncbi:MAG TPA: phospholipase D-like domain-containing protein, partial [Candidatus Dormibacteraeota bacterium]|nr:phospholipase D-like domain-containing protein [Candidatus Dormibacteraeota bacterium]